MNNKNPLVYDKNGKLIGQVRRTFKTQEECLAYIEKLDKELEERKKQAAKN